MLKGGGGTEESLLLKSYLKKTSLSTKSPKPIREEIQQNGPELYKKGDCNDNLEFIKKFKGPAENEGRSSFS